MKKNVLIVIILFSFTVTFAQKQEIIKPFINMVAIGDRLIPLQNKNIEFGFRVWINRGTSIDRVITITKSYEIENEIHGFIYEISNEYKNRGEKKTKVYCSIRETEPKSGYNSFFKELDTLDLLSYTSQKSFGIKADHSPYSVFMVEVKNNEGYNYFEFNTYWPYENESIDDKYEKIIDLITREFDFDNKN